MKIVDDVQLDFDDVLIGPRMSDIKSRGDVSIMRTFRSRFGGYSFRCVPVCCANMSFSDLDFAEILSDMGYMCALEKHIDGKSIFERMKSMDEDKRRRIFVSSGIREGLMNLHPFINCGFDIGINLDVPNGHIESFFNLVKDARRAFPGAFIIAGTVSTAKAAKKILDSGADCVRGSIGGGSMCLTRMKTGVGRPNFSTTVEVSGVCHRKHGYFMCDGGMKASGDICKAFGAGADFVMSGSMFAGCDEAKSDERTIKGKKYKLFYGMSSNLAMERLFNREKSDCPEGREKWVPCTGRAFNVVSEINGGIRSMMAYIGAYSMEDIPKRTVFYRVNRQLNDKFAGCDDFQEK